MREICKDFECKGFCSINEDGCYFTKDRHNERCKNHCLGCKKQTNCIEYEKYIKFYADNDIIDAVNKNLYFLYYEYRSYEENSHYIYAKNEDHLNILIRIFGEPVVIIKGEVLYDF